MANPPDPDETALMEQRLLWAERDVARAEQRTALAEQTLREERKLAPRLRRERAAEAARAAALQALLASVYASFSWRVSRPLRAASAISRGIRRRLRPLPPAELPVAAVPPPPAEHEIPLSAREQQILQRLQDPGLN